MVEGDKFDGLVVKLILQRAIRFRSVPETSALPGLLDNISVACPQA